MANKPVHRGDRVISRKAIAQGRPGVHRCPVCSCAAFLVQIAHETAGAARTRSSLRPLFSRARKFLAKLGRIASRECEAAFRPRCIYNHRRRPGLDPGPIRRGPPVRTLALETFCKQYSPRSMGPGVRRDDAWRELRQAQPQNAVYPPSITKQSAV